MTLPETPPQPAERHRSRAPPYARLQGNLRLVGQEIPRSHDAHRRAQALIPSLSCGTSVVR